MKLPYVAVRNLSADCLMTRYLSRLNHKPINQPITFPLEEKILVHKFHIAIKLITRDEIITRFLSRYHHDIREHKSNSKSNN